MGRKKVNYKIKKMDIQDEEAIKKEPVPRTESDVHSESANYNAGTIAKQLFHEEVNSAYNHHVIVDAYNSGRARDISDEPRKNGQPCIILGSGPSLDRSIENLRGWEGGIICTNSHARTLMHYGIEPTHILVLDPFSDWPEISGIDWSKTKTKLIVQPGVMPDLVKNWPNEMLLYVQNAGSRDSFYATTQKRQYTWRTGPIRETTFHFMIRTEIVVFACSPCMQLFAADLLGYGACFLAGVDFGFVDNKERFTDWDFDDNGNWRENVHPFMANDKTIVGNNGVPTEDIHLFYKKNFLSAWRLSHQTIYSTDRGLMKEVPFIPIGEVVACQGLCGEKQKEEDIDTITEKYLANVGAFVIKTKKAGIAYVESAAPEKELLAYMQGLNRSYECSRCRQKFTLKDDSKEIDLHCTNCGGETLVQNVAVDIDSNMVHCLGLIGKEWKGVEK